MKISQMVQREDFYSINQKTLDRFFVQQNGVSTLYIYPELNAIMTATPSKAVKQYLRREYLVRSSNVLKKVAVATYVGACMNSRGLMAAKKMQVQASVSDDLLVYPCNKKYRIFDFATNTVSVIIKDGFSDNDLKREIQFRTKQGLPNFVPVLRSADNAGYTETIIDGVPLARISDHFDDYRDEAYKLLLNYTQGDLQQIVAGEYAQELRETIRSMFLGKVHNREKLFQTVDFLTEMISDDTLVNVGFSHGDFQAGNIWVENGTNHIYIIDWESWGTRSLWYDKAVLYQGLRPGGLHTYFSTAVPREERAIVLLEDVIFQLNELNNLPLDFGQQQFDEYVTFLTQKIEKGSLNEGEYKLP